MLSLKKDHIFGLNIPKAVEDVPTTILQPINAWTDKEAYTTQAKELVERFKENFKKIR